MLPVGSKVLGFAPFLCKKTNIKGNYTLCHWIRHPSILLSAKEEDHLNFAEGDQNTKENILGNRNYPDSDSCLFDWFRIYEEYISIC